jgi:hypothetical protein
MYRRAEPVVPPCDSGWRFFACGDRAMYRRHQRANWTDVGVAPSEGLMTLPIGAIVAVDRSILGYLDTPAPCAFERAGPGEPFRQVELELPSGGAAP